MFSSKTSIGVAFHTSSDCSINPGFFTGLVDGEGTFGLYLKKTSRRPLGWSLAPVFELILHKKDKVILEQIKSSYLSTGTITKVGTKAAVRFRIESIKDFPILLDHLDKFP